MPGRADNSASACATKWRASACAGNGYFACASVYCKSVASAKVATIPPDPDISTFSGGVGTIEESATGSDKLSSHGKYAYKWVSPGGAGKGGGYLTTEDFMLISKHIDIVVKWDMKGTADVKNIVQVRFFNSQQIFISSVDVYNEETTNPTDWKAMTGRIPANAIPTLSRFIKLKLVGCNNTNTTAGNTVFDNVSLSQILYPVSEKLTGSAGWTCPPGIVRVKVRIWGGGAGGGTGGGGGAGEYVESTVTVTPGVTYVQSVGAGGAYGVESTFEVDGENTIRANPGLSDTRAGGTEGTEEDNLWRRRRL